MRAPQRRGRIESAAARLFAKKGYEATSMDEIASAAGISKRVIYDHFGSKRDLHIELLEAQHRQLWESVAARLEQTDASPEVRWSAAADAFFAFCEDNPYAWRMLFRDPPSDPASVAVHRRLQQQATESLAALIAAEPYATEAVAAGLPRTTELLAEMLKNAMAGAAGWWYEHRDVPRQDIVAALMGFAWLGMERLSEGGRWTGPGGQSRTP
jgi:AcrR family transcriptional regulator